MRTVEAHLLDFDADLYGRTVTIQFARWQREQQVFPNVEALRQQMDRDRQQTRHWQALGLLDGLLRPQSMAVSA